MGCPPGGVNSTADLSQSRPESSPTFRESIQPSDIHDLRVELDELRAQMGDEIGPFPGAGMDGFLSHFIITLEWLQGDSSGELMSLTMPTAIQTVSRSDPFIYAGASANHSVDLPLPTECTLPRAITEHDFLTRPDSYFEEGKETVWMQILNLDARMDTEVGPIRIILGETLKRDYPDVFAPSLGVAQSLGRSGGFPARLFFNPVAMIETPRGAFRAVHGTLAYGRITSFPPIGTPVTIDDLIPLNDVESIRTMSFAELRETPPPARIVALSHPIDMAMQVPGEEAFRMVEARIRRAAEGGAM